MSLSPPPHAKQPRIESLYSLKAIASFFVVMVHSSFFQREWFMFIIGVGTPCFLSITGYLLYSSNLKREQQKCIKWAKKSWKLALICFALYWTLHTQLLGLHYPISTLLINLITGTEISFPLWYLTALWQALLLLYLIRTYVPTLIYYLPLLYIIAYILRVHPDVIPIPYDNHVNLLFRNNAIITSLPFLCCGYLIHKHKKVLLHLINVDLWLPIIFLVLLAEYAFRVFCGLPFELFSFCTFPCILLLMLFCVRHPDLKIPGLNTIGRKHSANIYYFHMAVISLLHVLEIYAPKTGALIVWIICIPLSFLFNTILTLFNSIIKRLIPQ